MSYRKLLECCVDGLVGDFRMPRSPRRKVPLPVIPLQPPHHLRPDRLIYHVDHQLVKFPANVSNRCTVRLARGDIATVARFVWQGVISCN